MGALRPRHRARWGPSPPEPPFHRIPCRYAPVMLRHSPSCLMARRKPSGFPPYHRIPCRFAPVMLRHSPTYRLPRRKPSGFPPCSTPRPHPANKVFADMLTMRACSVENGIALVYAYEGSQKRPGESKLSPDVFCSPSPGFPAGTRAAPQAALRTPSCFPVLVLRHGVHQSYSVPISTDAHCQHISENLVRRVGSEGGNVPSLGVWGRRPPRYSLPGQQPPPYPLRLTPVQRCPFSWPAPA